MQIEDSTNSNFYFAFSAHAARRNFLLCFFSARRAKKKLCIFRAQRKEIFAFARAARRENEDTIGYSRLL